MKSINDIRAHLTELSETTDDAEMRKLSSLVRSGLFDAKKLTLLKRALNKDNLKMTKAERDTLLELLDKLLNVVTTNQGVFQKVKQSVSEDLVLEDYEFSMARSQLKTIIRDAEALLDQIQGEGEMESWMQSKITLASDYIGAVADNVVSGESEIKKIKEDYEEISLEEAKELVGIDVNQMPAMLILKRRAIRVFPDGQKVGLYYSDRLNKFVTIPFSSIGLSEDTLQERNVDWAWEQGYRKRHATANDETLSPAQRANATAELDKYHQMTKSRFGKSAAYSLQSTFDKAQGQVQAAKAAAKARSNAMADRGLADKMNRRAAKQGELRSTLKSKVPGTFGQAYGATGSLAGAVGVALGTAARKGILKATGAARRMGLRESFGEKLQLVREQALPKTAPSIEPTIPRTAPRVNIRVPLPGGASPANQNLAKVAKTLSPSALARLAGLGLTTGLAGAFWLAGTGPAGGKGDEYADPKDVADTKRKLKADKITDIKGFSAPPGTAPDATPAQAPAPAPKTAPDIVPAQQPAIVAAPAAAPLARPAAEPAPETSAQPKGRSRTARPKTKAKLPVAAAIGGNLKPWDISAGKGSKGDLNKVTGLDPFKINALNAGTAGTYATQAQAQKVGKIQRDAMKAMVRNSLSENSPPTSNNSQQTNNSGESRPWDITAPQKKASEIRLDRLQGINPIEKMSDSSRGGVYSTPAVAMQQQLLNIRVQKAMSRNESSTIDALKSMISENTQTKELQIGEEYITINNGMAKKIVHVYESVNKINKLKIEKMLDESVDSFAKILQFSTKN